MSEDVLFDNPKRKRPPRPFPADALAELVNLSGAPLFVVRKWPEAQKWAILYRCRERSMNPQEARDKKRRHMADRLADAVHDERAAPEMHDLLNEALSFLDCGELYAVAASLALILAPPLPIKPAGV